MTEFLLVSLFLPAALLWQGLNDLSSFFERNGKEGTFISATCWTFGKIFKIFTAPFNIIVSFFE